MRKILNKYSYCVFFFFVGGFVVLADPPVDPPFPVDPPPEFPIDGWLVILFGAALLLGFYKIYMLKKKHSI
ncbi:hypothetical protein [Flavobacterium undicola]|uniref:hypothetical protein n=1 Tax=Flavobacterium undicola TaxID=1932779 RepID=UPI0013766377|nr:hypothetical protein [Flavobacterium undicola]MBA0882718.1 hypothetical protein [Flavobacterium undicola]